jgi:hypothetical protein
MRSGAQLSLLQVTSSGEGAIMSEQMNGQERTSLIQGVINAMDDSAAAKQRAIDLLKQLQSWLENSLGRDYGFRDRLVRAVAENPVEDEAAAITEEGIKNIAEKYSADPKLLPQHTGK